MDVVLKARDREEQIQELIAFAGKDRPEGTITLRVTATLLKDIVMSREIKRLKFNIVRRVTYKLFESATPPTTQVNTLEDLKVLFDKMQGKTLGELKEIHKEYIGYA